MARTEASFQITDAYQQHLLADRFAVAGAVAHSWQSLDPSDLDGSGARWVAGMAPLLAAYQARGVTASDGYLSAFLASELATHVPPRGIDPTPYLVAASGAPLDQLLVNPLVTVKLAVAKGRPIEVALHLGLVRATRTAAVEALDAPRRALLDLMAEDDRVEGWERLTSPHACGACLALATGDTHDPHKPLPTHDHCRCVTEPVVKRVRHTVRRQTGREMFDALSPDEQAALFHGRGGAEKAELLRSGAVPFDALVHRDAMAAVPDQFTEASLTALREHTHG